MNKKIILSIIIVILAVIAAIVKIQYFSGEEDETKNIKEEIKYEKFIGKITEKSGTNLIVTPNSNEDIAKSSNKISIQSEYDFKIGDMVLVTYTGFIMETYPAQVDLVGVERYFINETSTKYTALNDLSEAFNTKEALKEGYLVNTGLKKYNIEQVTNFIESVNSNIPCTIRIAQSTMEGDTIITEIKYTKESKVNINHDSTRDEFSSEEDRRIVEYTFDNIIKYKNESGEYFCAFNGDTMSDEKMDSNDCYTILKID